MAELTYTVTVASGNLYGGGTGNVFYLDGARNSTGPGTVTWVNGGTLRFEQSNASNDGHPLIFSTTTSRAQYLTSGVTYYLDGASNYASYVNTTSFNAATTRYVEVTPSSSTDFYYLCYVHGIGMGGIFDIESNVWGGLSWGNGAWGDQGHVDVSVTGSQLTSTIGNETQVIDNQVTLTGLQLTSTVGTSVGGTSALVLATGSLESMAVGSVIQRTGQGFAVSGSQLTSTSGSATIDETILTGEGWGRGEWGEFAWGDNFSVQVTGIGLTSSIGNETAFTDGSIPVSGQQLTTTFASPSFSIQIDSNVFVLASEDQLDALTSASSFPVVTDVIQSVTGIQATISQGNTVGGLKTPVDVSGIQATMTLGSITLEQTTVEPVTGQQLTMTLGQHADIPGQLIGVGGLQLSSLVGSVTAKGTANIVVTGIQLTASVGSPNITAWAEVDPGVNNVWTVVDQAA
tara:strand:- start:693 stop:2069 length:1377 start_codon:yes stop_codon:yes gene_type:complete